VIPLDAIRRARGVLDGVVIRTPLVRLDVDADAEIWLKLELLQPVRSFKLRGAGNAILSASDADLAQGVVTASAGNMAQGVAYAAGLRGVPATIVVPAGAPRAKLDAVERYGGRVIEVPYDEWWEVMTTGRYPPVDGLFVHPVWDEAVQAGNGTIGLELLEQSSDFDAVVVPYGGGGLLTGIASAVKRERPEVRIVSAEPGTAAPAAASHAAGRPTAVDFRPSFVDGAGSREVMPRVWAHVEAVLDGAEAIPLADVADAIRVLAERSRVVAEGAGALGVAAALTGRVPGRKLVCIVSGGNIDVAVLRRILGGEAP
jgi:threonine dehydratase